MEQNRIETQKQMDELKESIRYLNEISELRKKNISEIQKRLSELQQQVEENNKMIEIYTDSIDPNHSIFSPHQNQEFINHVNQLTEDLEQKKVQQEACKEQLNRNYSELEHFLKIKNQLQVKIDEQESEKQKTKDSKYQQAEVLKTTDETEDPKSSIGIKILEIQENERQRIAMELHDTIVQNLTGLVHKTEFCTRLLDIDIIRARLELLTMTELLRTAINDLRTTIYNLRPMSLSDLGLPVTVERLLNSIQTDHRIQTVFHVEGVEKGITPVINLTLYRVIQEACNNIIKHANAVAISVFIKYKDSGIEIEIQDNGTGFCTQDIRQEQPQGYGLGMSIMRERIYLLSGTLEVSSQEGKGTKIRIYVPFVKQEEEVEKCGQ